MASGWKVLGGIVNSLLILSLGTQIYRDLNPKVEEPYRYDPPDTPDLDRILKDNYNGIECDVNLKCDFKESGQERHSVNPERKPEEMPQTGIDNTKTTTMDMGQSLK